MKNNKKAHNDNNKKLRSQIDMELAPLHSNAFHLDDPVCLEQQNFNKISQCILSV